MWCCIHVLGARAAPLVYEEENTIGLSRGCRHVPQCHIAGDASLLWKITIRHLIPQSLCFLLLLYNGQYHTSSSVYFTVWSFSAVVNTQ